MTFGTSLWVLLLATVLAVALGGLVVCAQRQDRAVQVLHELEESRQSAARILALQDAPEQAQVTVRPVGEMSATVERAAQRAGIAAEQILSIQPRTARRLGDGPYKEQPTDVELQSVTLAQVLQLAQVLAAEQRGLQVRGLRISAPRAVDAEDRDERWFVEMTLTYLIYAPKSSPGSTGGPVS